MFDKIKDYFLERRIKKSLFEYRMSEKGRCLKDYCYRCMMGEINDDNRIYEYEKTINVLMEEDGELTHLEASTCLFAYLTILDEYWSEKDNEV